MRSTRESTSLPPDTDNTVNNSGDNDNSSTNNDEVNNVAIDMSEVENSNKLTNSNMFEEDKETRAVDNKILPLGE